MEGRRQCLIPLAVCVLTLAVVVLGAKLNCNKRGYICVDKTRYRMCREVKPGVTETISETVNVCPSKMVCGFHDETPCSLPPLTVSPRPTLPPTKKATPKLTTKKKIVTPRITTEKTLPPVIKTTKRPVTPKITTKKTLPPVIITSKKTLPPKVTTKVLIKVTTVKPPALTTVKLPVVTEEPIVTPPPGKPGDFGCPRLYPRHDPKNCRAYYYCLGFWEVHKLCPLNTVFNARLKVCDRGTSQC